MIWIPYIIFQNTDDDEAVKVDAQTEDGTMRTKVSIKRENNFTRSGPEIADEVVFILFQSKFILVLADINIEIEIFNGGQNIITMSQTHSKKFHCTYLLHYYPFDTQVIHLKSDGPHLPLFKCVDLPCGPADRAVCPEQRGAGARHHGAAH